MEGKIGPCRLPQAASAARLASNVSHMRQKFVIPIERCRCAVAFPLAGGLPPVAATPGAPGNPMAKFWPAAVDRSLPPPTMLRAPQSPIAETLSRPLGFAVPLPAFRRGFSDAA